MPGAFSRKIKSEAGQFCFIIDAVESLDRRAVRLNTRRTGDAQYPPTMLLGLLAYNVRRLHTLARQQMPAATG